MYVALYLLRHVRHYKEQCQILEQQFESEQFLEPRLLPDAFFLVEQFPQLLPLLADVGNSAHALLVFLIGALFFNQFVYLRYP